MVSKNDSCTKFTERMSRSWYQVINRACSPVISFLLIRVIIQLMILLLAAMIRYLQRQVHQKTRWIWSKKFLIPKSTFLIGMAFSRYDIFESSLVCKHESSTVLNQKCSYSEFFSSIFALIWAKYGDILQILRISLYSVRMREKADQKNCECGDFLRNYNPSCIIKLTFFLMIHQCYLL